ncbi:MAG: hypothetical protein KME11_09900 [Timaviella obliquedivisa GSE-PSE-MK23-08B]|jgi:hypothetical protein|nr:hypothetical protein [Timaviella obliquedivisa GSE-PSE-MK23-08B]
MIQEVKQWIDEIQILQKKLTEAAQEREEAFASAAKWHNLYETEAKQRRAEANLARQNVNVLKAEIQQLQESPMIGFEGNFETSGVIKNRLPEIQEAVQQTAKSLQSSDDLQAQLMQAWVERDRLAQALKAEQANHAQTRQALTTALGDTIEYLNRERTNRYQTEQAEIQRQTVVITHETVQPQSKTPSLALPPTSLAQSRS